MVVGVSSLPGGNKKKPEKNPLDGFDRALGGALVGHTLGGLVAMADTTVDRVGLLVIAALTVLGLLVLDRCLTARERPATVGGEAAGES